MGKHGRRRVGTRREQIITYELYTLAARREEFRSITQAWMRASRAALERHFSPEVARAIDAHIEGTALHVALDPAPQTVEQTRRALRQLVRLGATPTGGDS
ncbi:MAG: hypothetical protein HOQ07_11710 [Sinomonas sp.]|nr:hypothetical protein [Sinomonas sp.]